jgi:lysozyme family protein
MLADKGVAAEGHVRYGVIAVLSYGGRHVNDPNDPGGETNLGIPNFLADRAVEYAGLPTFPRFGQGWTRRLFAVQQVCSEQTA